MTKPVSITILNHDLEIPCQPGYSLLHNFLRADAPIHTTCGGHANCGCCRIKILEETKGLTQANQREIRRLNKDLISQGWRLSCQTFTLRDVVVYMPPADELDPQCSKN